MHCSRIAGLGGWLNDQNRLSELFPGEQLSA
jgi:hypothetical protein